MEDLTLKDVETRVLNWLVKQERRIAGGVILLQGTKRALAGELGTSSETLSRTLARLRQRKLITVGTRTITVLAAPALLAQLRRNLGET